MIELVIYHRMLLSFDGTIKENLVFEKKGVQRADAKGIERGAIILSGWELKRRLQHRDWREKEPACQVEKSKDLHWRDCGFRMPNLLFLDEATSAMDNLTEEKCNESSHA